MLCYHFGIHQLLAQTQTATILDFINHLYSDYLISQLFAPLARAFSGCQEVFLARAQRSCGDGIPRRRGREHTDKWPDDRDRSRAERAEPWLAGGDGEDQ